MTTRETTTRTATRTATRKTSRPASRRAQPSEPPARYSVLTRTDEAGVVWHYPVRDVPNLSNIVDDPQADALYTPVMFMAARRVPRRRRRGTERQPSHAPIRFKSRARAVRFTIEDAELERELLRLMSAGRSA